MFIHKFSTCRDTEAGTSAVSSESTGQFAGQVESFLRDYRRLETEVCFYLKLSFQVHLKSPRSYVIFSFLNQLSIKRFEFSDYFSVEDYVPKWLPKMSISKRSV